MKKSESNVICHGCGRPMGPNAFKGEGVHYSEELAEKIITGIAAGKPLVVVCEELGGLWPATVIKWRGRYPSFDLAYLRAREDSADVMADEIIAIADDRADDWVQDPETGTWKPNHDHINRSRLRVEARKWAAAKLKPQMYGEKLEARLSGEITQRNLNINANIDVAALDGQQREQLRSMLLPLMRKREEVAAPAKEEDDDEGDA